MLIPFRNILFITGDHQCFGNHPDAKGVFDLDSIQLINIVKNMRDNGVFQNGDSLLHGNLDIFIGAAANPFADPFEYRVDRLEKKIIAGSDFIQTQSVFNLDKFNIWMNTNCQCNHLTGYDFIRIRHHRFNPTFNVRLNLLEFCL